MFKKIMIFIAAICMAVFTGCKTVPSSGTVYALSDAVGVATGRACLVAFNEKQFTPEIRNTTLAILNMISSSAPAENQTFTEAWTPLVNDLVAQFIDNGKIKPVDGELIKLAMSIVTKALDYQFQTRHPEWKKYSDIVAAAVHGFVDGFTYVVKPVNDNMLAVPVSEKPYDKDTYNFLMKEIYK